VRQAVPLPPSQPYPPGMPARPGPAGAVAAGAVAVPVATGPVAAGTSIISPQPLWSSTNIAFSARSAAVIRARVISRTDSAHTSPPPSAASIEANAHRSSAVDTSQLLASGSLGGEAYQPSGGSSTRSPPSGPPGV